MSVHYCSLLEYEKAESQNLLRICLVVILGSVSTPTNT